MKQRTAPLDFTCLHPCSNCPYRKDAPRRHWSRIEFETLLDWDNTDFGTVYGCHKNNGAVCAGWFLDQRKRGFPSIMLRMKMSKSKTYTPALGEKYASTVKMFGSIKEMIKANFPIIMKNFYAKQKDNEASQERKIARTDRGVGVESKSRKVG